MHVCPEESANCEKGRGNTEGPMTGKHPALCAIYLNYWSVMKFTHARLKHWVHHTENKLCVFNPAQRWQCGRLKETELRWLYTLLLAPRCTINLVGRGDLRTATACAQHANHSIYLRHKSGWANLIKLFMALMT